MKKPTLDRVIREVSLERSHQSWALKDEDDMVTHRKERDSQKA